MDINEIIKRLRYKAENIKAKLEPSYFSECADYLEKYRWHDLRKNPDDLPIYDKTYLCVIDTMGKFINEQKTNNEYRLLCKYQILIFKEFVIAWKEIEPFEDGE